MVATVLGFMLGALWYGPLFGKAWMAAVGLTPEQIRQDLTPVKIYGTIFVLGLFTSYVFGLFLGANPGLSFSIVAGTAAGLFWVSTSLAINYLFEGRKATLIVINSGYHIVRFTLIGLAFGLFG